MSSWKKIEKLSDRDAKTREAAFEAEMLAQIAPSPLKPPVVSTPLAATSPTVNAVDAVQIVVTENGQTNFYTDLSAVPNSVRQRILNVWRPAQSPTPPPIQMEVPVQPSRRPRSQRAAQALNLMLPGTGHFYLGKHLAGGMYAGGFIVTFVATIVIFTRAYFSYLQLSTGGDILEGQNIEQLAKAFPVGTLIALMIAGVVIYIASAIHLSRSRSA